MDDNEWQHWRDGNETWLAAITGLLFAETFRHADGLGSLIQPRVEALGYLDHAYPHDPPGFHDRLADHFVASVPSLESCPVAKLALAAWSRREQERQKAGEPCPCRYCQTPARELRKV